MKKRLLSAALALAMVLTLLPFSAMPAFAATKDDVGTQQTPENATWTDSSGATQQFYVTDTNGKVTKTVNVQRCSAATEDGRQVGKWYWKDDKTPNSNGGYTYYEATSGIVAGVGGSGQWYKDIGDYTNTSATNEKTVKGAFTMLGSTAANLSDYKDKSLTVDMAGTGALTVPTHDQFSNLKVTAQYIFNGTKPSVNGLITTRTDYQSAGNPVPAGMTINATNVNVGAINLAGRVNSITLTNCEAQSVTLDGETITDAKTPPTKTYTNQTLNATGCTITGKVTVDSATPSVSLTNCTGVTGVEYENSSGGSFKTAGTTKITGAFSVTARAKDSTYPTVDIEGGSLTGITQSSTAGNGNSITVNVRNSGGSVGAISVEKGTVNISGGKATTVAVKEGALNLSGSGVSTGNITLADNGKTTLNITATNSSFGDITVASGKGGDLTISGWPAGRVNSYGALSLDSYAGHGVKGGKFAAANANTTFGAVANLNWFDTSLQFYSVPKTSTNEVALYGRNELAQAIAESNAATSGTAGTGIAVLGQATGAKTLTLKNGTAEWAKIGYNTTTKFVLPTQINTVKVGSWVVDTQGSDDGNKRTFAAGVEEAISCPTGGMILNANPNGTAVSADEITNATNAAAAGANVDNGDVKVTLQGNKINLSGAVTTTAGGFATVQVLLTTNVLKTTTPAIGESPYEQLTVDVLWDVEKKTFQFDKSVKLDLGAIIDANGDLVLNNGVGAHYTVGGSLAVSAGNLQILDTPRAAVPVVVGAVGGSLSSRNQAQKDALIAAIQTGSTFDYSASPAFRQAVNAAQATITNDKSVTAWRDQAREQVWRNGYKSPDPTQNTNAGYYTNMAPHTGVTYANAPNTNADKLAIGTAFDTVYIVPYLLVTAINETQTGELTLTVQPYFRVDVSAATCSATCYYTVQAGRAMTLSGDMGDGVELTLPLAGTTFKTINTTNQFMHQDGKYVYKATTNAYTITHIGANGSLGTMVLNGTDGLITLDPTTANGTATCKYDSLQAAIDDTGVETRDGTAGAITAKDKITVPGGYTGSCDITMTGYARTIEVELQGLQTLKWSGAELSVTKDNASGVYTLQLKKDMAPAGGNITVASATGGSASVSANPAQVGSKVTVTLSAQAGYSPSGVSVKDSSGKAVSVSGSGSSYSFTMPSGSVTVTPSFTKTQVTNPTVHVSSTTGGSAYTSAGNNQVAPGTTVTVTTTPGTNQRTMGVSVTGATAVRTGANTFQFTVPSGYNTVTVTPRFDANNGTLFQDVWSYEYYSNPVRWAVERGITNGTSTYTFGSENVCTREDMVTFLWRAAGSPAVSSSVRNPFWDVQAGSYYYNAVLWAVSKGITNGVSANQFGVGQYVTRGQAVTFLYRYEGSPAAGTNSGFYDVNSREYYAKAVSWANAKGVTNGTSATTFGPNEYCKRAQIVTFLYRDITGNRA